jgi:ribonuclease HII
MTQEYSLTFIRNLLYQITLFLTQITLQNQHIIYKNIYPFPIRNLGAVVAVRKCSPSGDQRSNVVSAASILAISFRADVSHNSTLPWILPNPPRIKSDGS